MGDFPGGSDGKESACNAGDLGLIPACGRSLGEGYGNPLQYSRLENSTDKGAWWGRKGSGTTEQLTQTPSFQMGEGGKTASGEMSPGNK